MKVKKYKSIAKTIFTILIHIMLLKLYDCYHMGIENIRNNCPFIFNRLIKFENMYWTFKIVKWSIAYISIRKLFNIVFKTSVDKVEEKYEKTEITPLILNVDLLDYSNPFLYGKKTEDMLN